MSNVVLPTTYAEAARALTRRPVLTQYALLAETLAELPTRVADARRRNRWSMRRLARRINVSASVLSQFERGEKMIRHDVAVRLLWWLADLEEGRQL